VCGGSGLASAYDRRPLKDLRGAFDEKDEKKVADMYRSKLPLSSTSMVSVEIYFSFNR
jgi:hypothetical protein